MQNIEFASTQAPASRVRVVERPGLKYPWKIQIIGWRGRWISMDARKTEAEARDLARKVKGWQEEMAVS